MTYKYTVEGFDFFENVLIDPNYIETLNTVSVGDGDAAPSSDDTSLENSLYEADSSTAGITVERATGTGEIRVTIEFTGGSEVPAGSDIIEFGLKASDGSFLYREVRDSAISVASGETKIVEIRIFVDDLDVEAEQTITNVGLDELADIALGLSSEKMDTIAIGSGTSDVSPTDTTLQDELYRDDNSSSNIIVSTTGSTGEARVEATISAGADADDEVAGGSDISEFGLFSNGTLILHETRPAVTLEANDSKTFKIPFTIRQ